ncbi:unnamed protein product [Euphydryas editha]|uniref:Uncharacterized protein n=1 Tax=Euphydryas editha TaxID=104508 RepID=A0AAU9V8E1_EUPED|nr:unnamed protein product [Euphydryas editha]
MIYLRDPETSAAFYDVSSNPANFIKYQNNPKVLAALELLKSKFGMGSGPAPGAFAGFGGAPPAGAKNADDDVGLD